LFISLFTGERPTGIGWVDGDLLVGLGRRNKVDDDKGLPDGVTDADPYVLNFYLGLFEG